MKFISPVFAAVLTVLLTSAAQADLTVSFGTSEVVSLLPNTSNQSVEFFVAGGDLIDGMEFDIQLGDGGSDLGGTDTMPVISSIDLITGTIFAGAGPNQSDVVAFDLAAQSTVDTTSTVAGNGLIATVVFDTTGMNSGSIDLLLNNVAGSFSTFFINGVNTVNSTVPDGSINIVPEPASLALIGVGGLLMLRRRRA